MDDQRPRPSRTEMHAREVAAAAEEAALRRLREIAHERGLLPWFIERIEKRAGEILAERMAGIL